MIADTSFSSRILSIVVHASMLLALLVCVYPILHVAAVSLSDNTSVYQQKVTFIPKNLTFNAYEVLIRARRLPRAYRNSLVYTSLGTLVSMVLTTTMAYAIAKKRLPYRRAITTMVIITNISPSSPPMLGRRRSSPTPATCTRPSSTRHPRHCSPPQVLTG